MVNTTSRGRSNQFRFLELINAFQFDLKVGGGGSGGGGGGTGDGNDSIEELGFEFHEIDWFLQRNVRFSVTLIDCRRMARTDIKMKREDAINGFDKKQCKMGLREEKKKLRLFGHVLQIIKIFLSVI
jgi:hypothetical protein